MSYRKLKSKLFRTIARLSGAGLVLAGVAAVAFTVPSPQSAYTDDSTPPNLPTDLQVPAGNRLFGVNTTGGLKPTGACTEGAKALVPYTADYYFYKGTAGGH
jgi:Protein of unknown function (DUF3455)